MEDAYVIGIRLGLDNAVSAGIATIRADLMALDRAIAGTTANLRQLQNVSATVGIAANPTKNATPSKPVPEIPAEPQLPRPEPASVAIPAAVNQAGQSLRKDRASALPPAAPNPSRTGIEAQFSSVKTREPAAPPSPPTLQPPPPAPTPTPTPTPGVLIEQVQAAPGFRPLNIGLASGSVAPKPPLPIVATSPYRPSIVPAPAEPQRARERQDFPATAAPARRTPAATPIDRQAPVAPQSSRATSSWPAPTDRPSPEAAPAPAAPHTPQASATPTGGDVFLDGTRLGHWLSTHLAREAGRPPGGSTGFDPRLGIAWPGTQQGG